MVNDKILPKMVRGLPVVKQEYINEVRCDRCKTPVATLYKNKKEWLCSKCNNKINKETL